MAEGRTIWYCTAVIGIPFSLLVQSTVGFNIRRTSGSIKYHAIALVPGNTLSSTATETSLYQFKSDSLRNSSEDSSPSRSTMDYFQAYSPTLSPTSPTLSPDTISATSTGLASGRLAELPHTPYPTDLGWPSNLLDLDLFNPDDSDDMDDDVSGDDTSEDDASDDETSEDDVSGHWLRDGSEMEDEGSSSSEASSSHSEGPDTDFPIVSHCARCCVGGYVESPLETDCEFLDLVDFGSPLNY